MRCGSDDEPAIAEPVEDGIVSEDTQDFTSGNFGPAPGVETVCLFPKNGAQC